MLVIGWRTGANEFEATRVIRKHTGWDSIKVKLVVDKIFEGKPVELPNDFVLREDLETLKFILR